MPLRPEVAAQLLAFHHGSRFAERGGVITDLDGTAVHEREGRIFIAEPVVDGLKALVERGRPVVLNTLRFPLNVIQTFGHEWSAITSAPIPLISLNGAVVGLLVPTETGETTFDEIVHFPLTSQQIDDTANVLETLLQDGIEDIVLFHYPRDWREGEIVWTPRPERVDALSAKYRSAAAVRCTSLHVLRETLLREGATMLTVLVDVPEDRRMAYQHADPNRFISAPGIDKLSGAREAAARLDFDLDHSIGAGDTPMDRFLGGVGLAVHVGPLALEFRGLTDTVYLRDPFELGEALFELAGLPRVAHMNDAVA